MNQRLTMPVAGVLGGGELRLQASQLGVPIDNVLDGGTVGNSGRLGHLGDAGALGKGNAAGIGVQVTRDDLQQSALAGAVAPGDADLVACVNGQVDGAQHTSSAPPEIDLVEPQHIPVQPRLRQRWYFSTQSSSLPGRRARFHAPAAYLLASARVG